MNTSKFRRLVDTVRSKHVPPDEPPVTYAVIADRCRISRQYLYDLMNGVKQPTEAYTLRVAKGLGVPVTTVRKALGAV